MILVQLKRQNRKKNLGNNFFQCIHNVNFNDGTRIVHCTRNIDSGQHVVGWLVLLLYVPSQQLWSLQDGQFT